METNLCNHQEALKLKWVRRYICRLFIRKIKKEPKTRCFITAIIIVLKVKGNNTEVKEIKNEA